jgi:hypothetical protein
MMGMVETPLNPTPRAARVAHRAEGACIGPGMLQWNRGGWIGAQLGSTLWLGLWGAATAVSHLWAGLGILACCLGANLVGIYLWHSRARMAPHRGVQLLTLGSLCAASLSIALLYQIGMADELAKQQGGTLPMPLWAYLLVYPALMGILAVVDRGGKGGRFNG